MKPLKQNLQIIVHEQLLNLIKQVTKICNVTWFYLHNVTGMTNYNTPVERYPFNGVTQHDPRGHEKFCKVVHLDSFFLVFFEQDAAARQ